MNHYCKSEDKNTGVVNIIYSNTTKCLVTSYCYIPLQVKTNVCYARYLICRNTLSYNVEKSIKVIYYQQYCKKRCSHFPSKSSILNNSVFNRKQKTECISNSFNIALRESIFIQKLNILPSLNVRLHINYHLYLPNI